MRPVDTLALPLGDGWVLCQSDIDQLAVVNATGKIVWDLLDGGFGQDEIASAFALHFGVAAQGALANIRAMIGRLEEAGFLARPIADASTAGYTPVQPGPDVDCGTLRFGARRIRIYSSLAEVGSAYFARFGHRALDYVVDADVLAFSAGSGNYRLTFQDETVADVNSPAELIGRAHELILSWEHPKTEFLAYYHAAAVSRSGHSALLPGVSAIGKSTLTAYLVGHGFAYLGDDCIAMARTDWSLRPLPTCLSLKSGSWPLLSELYPELSHLPTVHYHGREARYVEPRQAQYSGRAPSVILFPSYVKDGETSLRALVPLQTMARLIETNTDLHRPATRATLAEFLQFVERTPAYELVYRDLASAKAAIEDWLEHA
jgi:hypothetical protein